MKHRSGSFKKEDLVRVYHKHFKCPKCYKEYERVAIKLFKAPICVKCDVFMWCVNPPSN